MLLHRWRKKVSFSHEHKLSQRSATLMLSIQQPMKDYQQRQWIQKMEHRCAYKLQVCWNEGRESWRDPAPATEAWLTQAHRERWVGPGWWWHVCQLQVQEPLPEDILHFFTRTARHSQHAFTTCLGASNILPATSWRSVHSSALLYLNMQLQIWLMLWCAGAACTHSRTRSSLQTNCDFHRSPITKHTGVQVRKVIPTKRLQVSLSLLMWVLRFSSRTTELPDGTHSSPPYQAEGIQGYHPSLLSLMDGICRLEESRPCPENWCWGPACTGALGYLASISPPQALRLFLHHGGDT